MAFSGEITGKRAFLPAFYARVEGLPYYFYANRQPSWSPPAGITWRKGLLLPEVTTEASVDLVTGLPRVGGMNVEFADDETGFFRYLFAAGRWDGDADVRNTEITGTGLPRSLTDAQTFPVLDSSAFASVTLPADFYVDRETVRISAAAGNLLTIATDGRGRYPAVGTTRFAYDHIPSTATGFNPRICAVVQTPGFTTPVPAPYTWVGRIASVYVSSYDPDANTYTAESDSALVFAGRIRSKEYTDRDTWRLACTHITDDLEREVFSPFVPTSARGYFFSAGQTYQLLTEPKDGGLWTLRATNTVAAGEYESWEALRDTMAADLAAVTLGGYRWRMEREFTTEAAGTLNAREFKDRTIFVMEREDATAPADVGFVAATGELGSALGMGGTFDNAQPWMYGLATNRSDVAAGNHKKTAIVLGPIPLAFLYHPADGGWVPGTNIPVSATDGFSVPDEQGSTTGEIVVGKEHLYRIDSVDSANRRVRVFQYLGPAPGFSGTPGNVYTQMYASDPPVSVQQVYYKGERVGVLKMAAKFLAELLYSTGQNASNGADDVLPRDWGLGIPSDLIEASLKQTLWNLTTWGARRLYYDRPTKMRDIVQAEATLFNWALTWRAGKIAAISVGQLAAPVGATKITTSVRVGRSIERPMDLITSRETAATIVNQMRLEMDRPPGSDTYRFTAIVNDTVSQRAFAETRAATSVMPGLLAAEPGLAQDLGKLLLNKLIRFNRPMPVVSFKVARPRYDLYAGQIVLLSDSRYPNPFTGARGLVDVPVRLISVRFDWREQVGDCTAIMDPALLYTRLANIAPSARITARTAGAPNDTLTLSVNEFTPTTRTDVSLFEAADAVRIVEADPSNVASPQNWQRAIVSITGNDIKVATLAGYDATKTYYVEFDTWSAAVAGQRTDAVFEGDSTDDKIENSGKTYYWL